MHHRPARIECALQQPLLHMQRRRPPPCSPSNQHAL
eukprot:CAMPEP_0119386116 /NCGR_PEP_ID=MMETSP1334-20130426/94527_1 /TAXON_ID=127549 /ORGANISM="Calcidiscus leptoporus, Strain RCC1130" /LENGTH=35 /DNA_ID= /DNA_START= /DNA_END= /DNA_ORIENTATION=